MLQAVEECMLKWVTDLGSDDINELFKNLPKGKRLRAKLVLKIAGATEEAVKLAAIIELIHAASLLHDDVIDEASTRRGVQSVNATDGSKVAVMMGDVLYSKAYTELVSFDERIARAVAQAVTVLSIGEYDDVKMGESFNENEDAYLEMIYKKTASLIEASTWAAAILIQHPEADKFRIYGKNLGLAFQIIDDILDITQTSEQLGKPAMNDFVEGKTTLPYIYLYSELDENDKNFLKSLHLKKLDKNETDWLINNLYKTNSIKKSFKLAKDYSQNALISIQDFQTPELETIVEKLVQRCS
jgi:octaprenyl-diphosphate synthase